LRSGRFAAPDLARTATTLSSVINGVGTVLLLILIDPVEALIPDQALRGSRPVSEDSASFIEKQCLNE
jgi:hypothetical protein